MGDFMEFYELKFKDIIANKDLLLKFAEEIENLLTNKLYKRLFIELSYFSLFVKKYNLGIFDNNLYSSIHDFSLIDIYEKIMRIENNYKSNSIFKDFVIMHNNIKIIKSRKNISCDFSGALILKNSFYCCYRPLFELINSNNMFVLKKSLKVEQQYEMDLPKNILEFEELLNFNNYSDFNNGKIVLKKIR